MDFAIFIQLQDENRLLRENLSIVQKVFQMMVMMTMTMIMMIRMMFLMMMMMFLMMTENGKHCLMHRRRREGVCR